LLYNYNATYWNSDKKTLYRFLSNLKKLLVIGLFQMTETAIISGTE